MTTKADKAQAAAFRALIMKLEPAMQRAFLDAVASLYMGADYRALNDALARGDVDAAVESLRIDSGAFIQMFQVHQQTFFSGATETVATLTLSGVSKTQAAGIRFDFANPRAESWLATTSAQMVQQVSDDTKKAVRETVLSGYQAGRGPRDIATDIAGRVVGGQRQGGVLGLDSGRAHRLEVVSQGMKTADGVKSLVTKRADGTLVLNYKVNAATEKAILAAYKRGEAVPDGVRLRSEAQFRNALLKSRADTVAQVETARAVMAGRDEEWRQLLESLGRDPSEVKKIWQHGSGGTDPRWWHVQANGMEVIGLDTPFVFADGSMLLFAHDPNGAAKDTIRCTCDSTFRLPPRKEYLL